MSTHASPAPRRVRRGPWWLAVLGALVAGVGPGARDAGTVTVSVVATTDLHGYVEPRSGVGGLAVLGGYLHNLRAARAADRGGVVLVDAGDTWLGGTASNLSEGAIVVDAYNALGYDALAIGNHDLEFGAVDPWWARPGEAPDPRGALKARARDARFPFLAANLVERSTGHPVTWPNVRPSAVVEVAGVRIGLVGVMTKDALSLTLAPNVVGLATTPLAPAIEREARLLRRRGATAVVVVAHAGGSCAELSRPDDLTTCDHTAEIFDVARTLPAGLVDAIAAGHTHDAVAHRVSGIPIVQAYSWGRAFARVDLAIGRADGAPVAAIVHPPHTVCAWRDPATGDCVPDGTPQAVRAEYEGRPVAPRAEVAAAMRATRARVERLRATPVGPRLASAIGRGEGPGNSPLGNLVADALRAAVPGAEAALSYGGGPGGLRADLPAGPATFGTLYDVFPFDNRVDTLALSGAEIATLIGDHRQRPRWGARALGVSGLVVTDGCDGLPARVAVTDADGRGIAEGRRLVVAMSDFLAARARRLGLGRPRAAADLPLVREALVAWMRRRAPDAVRYDVAPPRWRAAEDAPAACAP